MNSENGGLSSSEKQRRTAVEIARGKVLEAYGKSESRASGQAQAVGNTAKYKENTPGKGITAEEWKKYHSAWQNYYQKYYSEYYSRAAKDYVAQQKLKTEIQEKAAGKEEKIRHRKKMTPIIAGVSVILLVLFLQYNRLIFAPIAAYVSPGESPATEIEAVDPTVVATNVSSESKLIIPKINVEVPIEFETGLQDVMAAMNHGVVHYRINGASAYPGEIGNFVITGHSAGDIYSSNPYKFIFSGLERLEDKDLIYVHYKSKRYTYRVTKKEVIEPTQVSKLVYETSKPMLTLVTCTPLGTSRYRLLVTAEQISPSYEGATVAESNAGDTNLVEELPENEKTMFERIWDWLTGQ